MKSFKLCLAILMLASIGSAKAQNTPLLQTTPKSPNMAAFDKYVETPVSLGTGKINVSVPIYEINTGSIKIPISLNYNNNGLRPDEIPSWVGLGWSLSAGGSVSFQQKGRSDFNTTGGMFYGGQTELNTYLTGGMTSILRDQYFEDIIAGSIDSEYDVFYYNIPSGSGAFHFPNSTQAQLAHKADVTITKISTGFKLVDDTGNSYYFETSELASSQNSISTSNDFDASSAMYLTKIVAPNGEEVQFKYKTFYLQYTTEQSYLMHAAYNGGGCDPPNIININESLNRVYSLLPDSIIFPQGYVKFIHSSAPREDIKKIYSISTAPYLAGIEVYDNGNVKKKDFELEMSYFGSDDRLRLDAIDDISGSDKGAEWKFEYHGQNSSFPAFFSKSKDHWGFANSAGTTYNIPRADYGSFMFLWQGYTNGYNFFGDRTSDFNVSIKGMLKTLTYPTGGTAEFEYGPNKFTLDSYSDFPFGLYLELPASAFTQSVAAQSITNGTTASSSFVVSQAGYYKLSSFKKMTPDEFLSPSADIVFTSGPSASLLNSKTNQCDAMNLQCVSSNEIVYLQAGTYAYDVIGRSYSSGGNTYYLDAWLEIYTEGTNLSYTVGGGRVEKVTHTDPIASKTLVNKYTYQDHQDMVSFKQIPEYVTVVEQYRATGSNCIGCGLLYTISESSSRPLVGNVIEYGKVLTLTDNTGSQGLTENIFSFSENIGGASSAPFTAPVNTSWRAGHVLQKNQYDVATTLKASLDKIFVSDTVGSHVNGIRVEYSQWCGFGVGRMFRVNLSTLISEEYHLTSTQNKLYDSSTPVTTSATYTYNTAKHHQPILTTQNNSDNTTSAKKTLYAFEYNNLGLASTSASLGIKLLNDIFKNEPVEQLETRTIGGTEYITGGTLIIYHSASPVPKQVLSLELNAPIAVSGFTFSNVDGSGVFNYDSRYSSRTLFNLYDVNLNVVEQQQANGIKEVILWSYKGEYPIAHIKHADYSTVETLLGGSTNVNNFRNLSNPSKSTIDTFLAPLRSGLTSSMITSITYDPLSGMTSQTDPKGMTTYYEYDSYLRLQNTKDHNGNIVSNTQYNYMH